MQKKIVSSIQKSQFTRSYNEIFAFPESLDAEDTASVKTFSSIESDSSSSAISLPLLEMFGSDGDTIIVFKQGHYELTEKLQETRHGIVHSAKRKGNGVGPEECVVKILHKFSTEAVEREVQIGKLLNTPLANDDVPQFTAGAIECGQVKDLDETYAVLLISKAPGKDLRTCLDDECIKPNQFNKIAFQLAAGLMEIHFRGIIHGDIKPENTMLDPETLDLALIDFGFSLIEDEATDVQLHHPRGTLEYIAPEVHDPKQFIEKASDVFSLGLMLFELENNVDSLYGQFFNEEAFNECLKIVILLSNNSDEALKEGLEDTDFCSTHQLNESQIELLHLFLNSENRGLYRDMLDPDPAQRISIDEVVEYFAVKIGL